MAAILPHAAVAVRGSTRFCGRAHPAGSPCGRTSRNAGRSLYGPGGYLTPAEATAVVGALAFVAATVGVRLRWQADRRDAWWKRAEWAVDRSLDADPARRRVGVDSMIVLAGAAGATSADLQVLRVALEVTIGAAW